MNEGAVLLCGATPAGTEDSGVKEGQSQKNRVEHF